MRIGAVEKKFAAEPGEVAILPPMRFCKPPGPDWFKLVDRQPVVCASLLEWADWQDKHPADCIVAQSEPAPLWWVSTVFLGLNMRFVDDGPPLLFETAIFGAGRLEHQFRCATWEAAEQQHEAALLLAQKLAERAAALLAPQS